MNIKINLQEDRELRDEVKNIIKGQVKKIIKRRNERFNQPFAPLGPLPEQSVNTTEPTPFYKGF